MKMNTEQEKLAKISLEPLVGQSEITLIAVLLSKVNQLVDRVNALEEKK